MKKEMPFYTEYPDYDTEHFHLRLVEAQDAPDLLVCYSDRAAVERMNADRCTSDFHYTTLSEMQDCIQFWLESYHSKYFTRLSLSDKATGKIFGTMELCAIEHLSSEHTATAHSSAASCVTAADSAHRRDTASCGDCVLRIDLAQSHDREEVFEELLALTVSDILYDCQFQSIFLKAGHTPDRVPVLDKYRFKPTESFRPGLGYYEYQYKGFAYCGLVCCECSEGDTCPGCHAIENKDCKNWQCCHDKNLAGCHSCQNYPCDAPMLSSLRNRAFHEFIQTYGEKKLLRCLMVNKLHGIYYHYPKQLKGDYDKASTIEEIISLLLRV